MKRFSIISVLLALASEILACAIPGTHNYYLFSVVNTKDFRSHFESTTLDNWRAYAGKQDLWWFDADEMTNIARRKGDVEMIGYIANLQRYLDICANSSDSWAYPTKEQKDSAQHVLRDIGAQALAKTATRLRSQQALLHMRCNMMLGEHEANIAFWEQKASAYINSVYRDMMRNIYAGALLKTGRADEATTIYIEQGDMESLYTYYYKKRSYDAIRAEYEANPDSPAFPFLLQDFANNTQECIDSDTEEGNWPGKMYVRNINQKESRLMCQLAEKVVDEGHTSNPVLWQSLRAWLLWLNGNREEADEVINKAINMKGTQRAKDNARALRLYIHASIAPVSTQFNNFLTRELLWLEKKMKQEGNYGHYTRVYDRLTHQILIDKYRKIGQPEKSAAFLAWKESVFDHLNTADVKEGERYLSYLQKKPVTLLDHFLKARIKADYEMLHELIGTKYMRLARWQEAIPHLEKVSLEYINQMDIAPYMAQRTFRVEPWIDRQRISSELQIPGSVCVKNNQKLAFAREMLSLETGFDRKHPIAKAIRAYLLAIRYTQASSAGDAWYLTQYGKSCIDSFEYEDNDNEPKNNNRLSNTAEPDFLAKASSLLEQAKPLRQFVMQERILFAQAYLPVDCWYKEVWNDEQVSYIKKVRPDSRQYKALLRLTEFEKANAERTSPYVSRCDVLRQFRESL